MNKEELIFCPLGGSGEIGMNMNLYAYGKEDNLKWIVVDMGVTFADDSIPGIDLIYPDPDFLLGKKDDLLGIAGHGVALPYTLTDCLHFKFEAVCGY